MNRSEALVCPLLYMLRVKLRDLELLLACEVHHEDVEGISTGQLAILNLRGHSLHEVSEVLIVIIPVAASQLCVHKSHQRIGLVNVELERLLVVLQCLVELPFELKHVAKTADRA